MMFSRKKSKKSAANDSAIATPITTTVAETQESDQTETTDTEISDVPAAGSNHDTQVPNDVIRAAARASTEASQVARSITRFSEPKQSKAGATSEIKQEKTVEVQQQNTANATPAKEVPKERPSIMSNNLKSKVKLNKRSNSRASGDTTYNANEEVVALKKTTKVSEEKPKGSKDATLRSSADSRLSTQGTTSSQPAKATKAIITVNNSKDFDKLIAAEKEKVVVVQFSADWCSPCKKIAPRLDSLATSYKNEAVFLKLDVEDVEDLVMRYNISSLPTFLLIRKGEVFKQLVGGQENKLVDFLLRYLGNEPSEEPASVSTGEEKRVSVVVAEAPPTPRPSNADDAQSLAKPATESEPKQKMTPTTVETAAGAAVERRRSSVSMRRGVPKRRGSIASKSDDENKTKKSTTDKKDDKKDDKKSKK